MGLLGLAGHGWTSPTEATAKESPSSLSRGGPHGGGAPGPSQLLAGQHLVERPCAHSFIQPSSIYLQSLMEALGFSPACVLAFCSKRSRPSSGALQLRGGTSAEAGLTLASGGVSEPPCFGGQGPALPHLYSVAHNPLVLTYTQCASCAV